MVPFVDQAENGETPGPNGPRYRGFQRSLGRHHEGRVHPFEQGPEADEQPFVQKLVSKDVLTERDLDVARLKPFRMTAKRMEISRDRNSTLKWCYGSLTTIEKMARAMGHLVRFSVTSEYL